MTGKKCTKSVMHVQSCCFALLSYCFFKGLIVVAVVASSGDVTRGDLQRRFSTQRCNVGTMLQPFETMSQQCCTAVLVWKSSLQIFSCNITFKVPKIEEEIPSLTFFSKGRGRLYPQAGFFLLLHINCILPSLQTQTYFLLSLVSPEKLTL